MEAEAVTSVLVIDDREDVATTLAALCEALGMPASVPRSGENVRAMLERSAPSGVIVDIMMPEEDGYEALREIANYNPGMPVMLITGHGETWLRMGATLGRAHGLEYIETAIKPIRAEAIREFLTVVRQRAK